MNASDLYHEAIGLGLRLEARDDRLAVSPKERLTPEFAAKLSANKPELLAWLSTTRPGWGMVPPGDLALNPAMPRPTIGDRERLLGYLRRQTGDRPGPLCAWLVRRESAYFDGPGRHWDCSLHAYAVARDAACWQLGKTEAEVLDVIRGCEEAAR